MTEPLPRRSRVTPRIDLSGAEQKLLTAAWLGAVYIGAWLSLTPPVVATSPPPSSAPVGVVVSAAAPPRARPVPARAPRLRTRSS